jgi:hypothetical protein
VSDFHRLRPLLNDADATEGRTTRTANPSIEPRTFSATLKSTFDDSYGGVVVVEFVIVVVVVVDAPPTGAEALGVGSPGPATVADVNEPPTVVEVVVVGRRGLVVVVVAGIVVVVAGIVVVVVVVVVVVGGGTNGGANVVASYSSVSAPLPKLVIARNSTG